MWRAWASRLSTVLQVGHMRSRMRPSDFRCFCAGVTISFFEGGAGAFNLASPPQGGGERRGSLPPLHMSRVSCIKPSSDQRHPWSGFVAQVWFESFPYNMEPGSSLWEVSGKEFPSKIEIWVRATDTLFLAVYMRNALQNHLHAITILDFRCIYDAAATFSTICVYAHYFVRFWTEMGPPGCPRAWS